MRSRRRKGGGQKTAPKLAYPETSLYFFSGCPHGAKLRLLGRAKLGKLRTFKLKEWGRGVSSYVEEGGGGEERRRKVAVPGSQRRSARSDTSSDHDATK